MIMSSATMIEDGSIRPSALYSLISPMTALTNAAISRMTLIGSLKLSMISSQMVLVLVGG